MKINDKKLFILRILCVIGVVVGIAMMCNRPIQHQVIRQNQTHAIQHLKKMTPKAIQKNQHKKGNFKFNTVKSMDTSKAVQTHMHPDSNLLGAIAIPDVNMYLPISLGLSDASMSTGGGTMRPDQVMGKGNYALAGHYMTDKGILFSPLENTQIGQNIYLTDLKNVYTYRIYMKKVVDPHSVYLVNNTKKPIVTLITCADGGKNRWAVRGKLVKTVKANSNNLQIFQL